MRYNKIRKMDISNGEGVRVSIFVQGCSFHCKNCFNQETWNFNGGKEFTKETIDKILAIAKSDYIVGLSILGGEPLHELNRVGVTQLAKSFKENFPNKTIWLWTGFLFNDIKNLEIMNYIDTLVDGQYIDELHDFTLKYCGSSNQRVIDVKESMEQNQIVIKYK